MRSAFSETRATCYCLLSLALYSSQDHHAFICLVTAMEVLTNLPVYNKNWPEFVLHRLPVAHPASATPSTARSPTEPMPNLYTFLQQANHLTYSCNRISGNGIVVQVYQRLKTKTKMPKQQNLSLNECASIHYGAYGCYGHTALNPWLTVGVI